MHGVHVEDMDVNLLVLLDALLAERSVTRAAQKVGLSQSAASHALSRLRRLFSDPLLVREKSALLLTARAEELKPQLAAALALLRSALQRPEPFSPQTTTRSFSIGMGDFAQFVLLPLLMRRLAQAAPGIDIWAREMISGNTQDRLASGDLDFAIVPRTSLARSSTLRTKILFEEHFVCMARRDHPCFHKKFTLDEFVRLPHAFIAPRGTRGGAVDDALARLHKARRVALAVPHFLVAPYAVASSDLILTVASRVAHSFSQHLPLTVFDPPLHLAPFQMILAWHERTHRSDAHMFLRELIHTAARDELSPPP